MFGKNTNYIEKVEMYEESMRMPIFCKIPPKSIEAGTRTDAIIQYDFAPTNINWNGRGKTPDYMQGIVFKLFFETGKEPDDWKNQHIIGLLDAYMAHRHQTPGPLWKLRTKRYKLIFFLWESIMWIPMILRQLEQRIAGATILLITTPPAWEF